MLPQNVKQKKQESAFTLIEIMAVVVIIALLVGLVGSVVAGRIDQARQTTTKTQIKSLEQALEFYQMDNGRYPTTEQGLDALVEAPSTEPVPHSYRPEGYLQRGVVPKDPWKQTYQYSAPGSRNPHSFDLWSVGQDGNPSEDDIGNWADEED